MSHKSTGAAFRVAFSTFLAEHCNVQGIHERVLFVIPDANDIVTAVPAGDGRGG